MNWYHLLLSIWHHLTVVLCPIKLNCDVNVSYVMKFRTHTSLHFTTENILNNLTQDGTKSVNWIEKLLLVIRISISMSYNTMSSLMTLASLFLSIYNSKIAIHSLYSHLKSYSKSSRGLIKWQINEQMIKPTL